MKFFWPALLLLTCSLAAYSETVEVGQKDKAFTETSVTLKVGDTIKFVNNDPFFHNIFSLSDIQMFDLGSFPKGEFKEVVFEDEGEVQVECAIHPEMQMTVHVTK